MEESTVDSSTPNFTIIGAGVGTTKTENFTEFRNMNAPHGRVPCATLTKFSAFVPIKFGDSLKAFRPELWGFNFGKDFQPNFQRPLEAKLHIGCKEVFKMQE